MSKIEAIFKQRAQQGKKTHIAYITPEYPFSGMTENLLLMLQNNNVHIVEIGIPYSDPLADGPTIQQASDLALKNNVTISKIFKILTGLKGKVKAGLVLMGYINPILSYGLEKFAKDAQQAGISGIIIPDVPVEETDLVLDIFKNEGLDLILLAAPTTPIERLKTIASHSSGFLYCVSVTGVTGARSNTFLSDETIHFLENVRSVSKVPCALGFGLSNAEQLKQAAPYTDGFIIGSALIKSMHGAKNASAATDLAEIYIKSVFSD